MTQTVAPPTSQIDDSVITHTGEQGTPATSLTPPRVRVGNAYASSHPDGTISVVAIDRDTCLRYLTPTTARDVYAALGQILGVKK